VARLKAPVLRRGDGSIPAGRVGFHIDGVVADIRTTFLDMARERQGPPPFRYDDIITFSLEKCLGFDPRIIAGLIRELIGRPHELARRRDVQSGIDGTATKSFWIPCKGNR